MVPFDSRLDHLVYAGPDLGEAEAAVRERLGVVPEPGGAHPDFGTRNSLVGLGPGRYLEIVGPDPDRRDFVGVRPFGIDGLGAPRLVTWAVKEADLEARMTSARGRGVDPGRIVPGRRRLPDGRMLAWRLGIHPGFLVPGSEGLVPFLIDWEGTPHPSASLDTACPLLELRGFHPEPGRLRPALEALGVVLALEARGEAGLEAVLAGPDGPVSLA